MHTQIFNTNLDIENFVDYLSLVFEDDNYTFDELRPVVMIGTQKGLKKYKEKKREVDLFVYVTYFAKKEVNAFKKHK